MDATQNNPPDQQMRWQCDGSLWMWEYERHRTPAQFDGFINRVRDGHLSVALNARVLVNGGAPAEAVLTFIENANVIGGQLNANINQQQIQTHLLKIGN